MSLLSIFGFGGSTIKNALRKGAVIIDVRTPHEFDTGKIPGAVNIPIDRIPISAERIMAMKKPVIFCCSSGVRSGSAARMMKEKGLKEVYNGGNWRKILNMINSL